MPPNIYIIAGPNGAGKTTFARKFLPKYADCRNFVNADLIAQGLSPLLPDRAAVRAGRLVLEEIESFASRRENFGFETTLSGRSYMKLIPQLKQNDYYITIFFLWLPNVEMSLSRIRARVARGGHDVPESDVRRRFDRSIRNFLRTYSRLADSWILFNNAGLAPELMAAWHQRELRIIDHQTYERLVGQHVDNR